MDKAKKSQSYSRKLKGLEPIISTILIIGVLSFASLMAYQWGMPMMEKNVDKTKLYNAETFLRTLDQKIDDVSKNGGSDQIVFDVPGEISVDPANEKIEFTLETTGSIYAPGGFACFSRNCDLAGGIWGQDTYSVLGAEVIQTNDRYAITKYELIFRNLSVGNYTYLRDIVTVSNTTIPGSKGTRILVTKVGEERGNPVKTIIKIDLL